MARASRQTAFRRQQATQDVLPEFDLVDGMKSAAAQSLRTGVGSALLRGFENMVDDSDIIPADQANKEYGLTGEFAIQPDEEITVEQAKAKAEDMHNVQMNEMITSVVNQKQPMAGTITQFGASIAAGFADPAMLALDAVGVGLVGKAASALSTSARAMNAISKVSLKAGRKYAQMFDQNAVRGLRQVMAREGTEGFVSSVLTETVNFAGVGEDRLARDVTAQESLHNIIAGTVLGGAFGTAVSKDGRKAAARLMGMKYGDFAPHYLKNDLLFTEAELNMGVDRSYFNEKMMDLDVFQAKEWQPESYTFAERNSSIQGEMVFVPIKEDGTVHSFDALAKGTVMTDNITHAQNAGVRVMQVDTTNVNLMTDADFINPNGRLTSSGRRIRSEMIGDLVDRANPETLSQKIALIRDPNVSPLEAPAMQKVRMKQTLNQILEGRNMREVMEQVSDLAKSSDIDVRVHDIVDKHLDELGFDGYQYKGKNFSGEDAFYGVYVKESSSGKLVNQGAVDSPKPDPGQQARYDAQKASMMSEYDAYVKSRRNEIITKKDEEVVGPKPDPEFTPPESPDSSALAGTPQKATDLDAFIQDLNVRQETGQVLSSTEQARLRIAQKIKEGRSVAEIVDEESSTMEAVLDCVLKGGTL